MFVYFYSTRYYPHFEAAKNLFLIKVIKVTNDENRYQITDCIMYMYPPETMAILLSTKSTGFFIFRMVILVIVNNSNVTSDLSINRFHEKGFDQRPLDLRRPAFTEKFRHFFYSMLEFLSVFKDLLVRMLRK